MGIFDFFSRLFGSATQETVVKKAAVSKQVTEEEQAETEEEPAEDENLWWENPILKDESVHFESVTNTILYDELHRSVKEHRLEIIEIPNNIAAILDILHRKNFKYPEIVSLVEHSPVLTGDFLSISNSAAFNRGIKIKSLAQALPRLGKQSIQFNPFFSSMRPS